MAENVLRLVTTETPNLIKEAPERFFEGKEFIPKRLADEIMIDQHFKHAGTRLYIYQDGVYLPNGEEFVEKLAQELLEEKSKTGRITETINYIKREVKYNLPVPDIENINLINGHLKRVVPSVIEGREPNHGQRFWQGMTLQ